MNDWCLEDDVYAVLDMFFTGVFVLEALRRPRPPKPQLSLPQGRGGAEFRQEATGSLPAAAGRAPAGC